MQLFDEVGLKAGLVHGHPQQRQRGGVGNPLRMRCLVSRSLDPFFNLALEDWLLETLSELPVLLLWRNSPCIVIGRNQIPWLECNVAEADRLSIPILRRYSGGGTVYHDKGNSLYSFMTDKSSFSRTAFAQSIVDHFNRRLEPKFALSPRHDITYDGRKVSGSAYRITRDRAYHHGTMLHNSNLGLLGSLLKSPVATLITGTTVSSVPSPVCNVPRLDHDRFVRLMAECVGADPTNVDEWSLDMEAIQQRMGQLKSWDWTFARGPKFRFKDMTIEEGIIVDAKDANLISKPFGLFT